MNKVYIGIGSNLGDRFGNLNNAISKISKTNSINLVSKSKVYESEPMYYMNQNFFLNMVVEISTDIKPLELLKILKNIELGIGRTVNQKHNNPRKIDLDILDYSNKIMNQANLKLPHPKLKERLFVLKPWSEIDPNHIVSNSKSTISDLMLLLDSNNKYIKLYNNKL